MSVSVPTATRTRAGSDCILFADGAGADDLIAERLGIPPDRLFSNIDRYEPSEAA